MLFVRLFDLSSRFEARPALGRGYIGGVDKREQLARYQELVKQDKKKSDSMAVEGTDVCDMITGDLLILLAQLCQTTHCTREGRICWTSLVGEETI